ncbi:MAG: polyphosphate kinase 1 [Anaerovoracaceae bacterium]|nr:polyphosphate kinase 1 [Bacillota bacterium]MDY2670929.1 polyphosphate kinase 1 [Anaerovoracaceae bacterium]
MTEKTDDIQFTQNRELSWLKFNDRVLDEGADESVPLFERLKFISIFQSNLDEFFMVRVGSLETLHLAGNNERENKGHMTTDEQLKAVFKACVPLVEKRDMLYHSVSQKLRMHGIYQLDMDELADIEKEYLDNWFASMLEPVISPQIIDSHHPFPHLLNKVIHIGARLKFDGNTSFGIIPVPASVPDIVMLPGSDIRFVFTEDLILAHIEDIFTGCKILETTVFCITRSADIDPDEADFELATDDFRENMKKALFKRKRLEPVRLEYRSEMSSDMLDYLCKRFRLNKKQTFRINGPLKMGYVFGLEDKIPENKKIQLLYEPFRPQQSPMIGPKENVIERVQKGDLVLSFPFESMDPFLRLLREAAEDPDVVSIKITIYRLAKRPRIAEYLCMAAENGKDVTAVIELRARFDEQENIDWSERMEYSGCQVIYGLPGYKVHSKVCLITRRTGEGNIQYITQIGTGNYNEKTAKQYTDLSLITRDQEIGRDAVEFFKNLAIGNIHGTYKNLLVSPVSLKSTVLKEIDEEIAKGSEGRIIIKINSFTDLDIIKKLKEASCAGVNIDMIIRGICCMLPGITGVTENVHIRSIVGRYLEHSRVYCFGTGINERMYIASADFMTRNTERRVEVACPIYDSTVRGRIHDIIDACLRDNTKARIVQSDGTLKKVEDGKDPFGAQQYLIDEALEKAAEAAKAAEEEKASVPVQTKQAQPEEHKGFFARLKGIFS